MVKIHHQQQKKQDKIMPASLDPKVLEAYVLTANSGKYKTWDEINSKFPELKGYDSKVLQEYVTTANSGKYKSWDDINAKFPEFKLGGQPQQQQQPKLPIVTQPTLKFGYSTPSEVPVKQPTQQQTPKIPSIEEATKAATSKISKEITDVPVEAIPSIQFDRQAEKDVELKKQLVYNDMRYARLVDKQEAQQRGYKNIQDYYKERESYLINNYLSEEDKEEARAQNAFQDAKKAGNEKLATEEMQNLLNAKSAFRKRINEQRQEVDSEEETLKKSLESGMPQDAYDAALKVLNQKRATLDLMGKQYYDPKQAMDKMLSDNITEVAAVSKPTQTAKEKLTEYTNALYTQLEIMREDLGWDADAGALSAYAKDYQLRGQGKGELVDKMYETELKLRNAVKILELNRTPIDNETGLGVFGKSFATSINPASASKQNTQQIIAQNLQSINEDAGISQAVDSEQKKFAEESAKEYKPYSVKWFAQPAGASAAIMLEFIPASMATEGAFAATKIGKLINIAEQYGKVKGLSTTAKYIDAVRKYKIANVGDSIGKFVLKTQANGLKFGTTSQMVASLFPKDADEVNFTTGYFGGQIGKGAEQMLGGAASSLYKLFGNKAPEAAKAIERLGEQFKFTKDAPKVILGEIGEEFGESLGQIYKETDSWKELSAKLDEQFGTLDKATQFVIQTGIMAFGMGGGSAIGSNLMKTSKDAYNKLTREQRAVVDEVLDSVSDEESKIVDNVTKDVASEIKTAVPQESEQVDAIISSSGKEPDGVAGESIAKPTEGVVEGVVKESVETPEGGVTVRGNVSLNPQELSSFLSKMTKDEVSDLSSNISVDELISKNIVKYVDKDTGEPCLRHGGKGGSFKRGGKWEVVKDLSGYKKHEQGGVDVVIGKNGVSIKNGGKSEFYAKNGLIVPAPIQKPIDGGIEDPYNPNDRIPNYFTPEESGKIKEQEAFLVEFIKSPKYKEMLIGQGLSDGEAQKLINERLSNVQSTKYFSDKDNKHSLRKAYDEGTPLAYTLPQSSDLRKYGDIRLTPESVKPNDDYSMGLYPASGNVVVHEATHRSHGVDEKNGEIITNITPQATEWISSIMNGVTEGSYDMGEKPFSLVPLDDKNKTSWSEPTEVLSRLNSIRKLLLDNGVYNPSTEAISPEKYVEFKKKLNDRYDEISKMSRSEKKKNSVSLEKELKKIWDINQSLRYINDSLDSEPNINSNTNKKIIFMLNHLVKNKVKNGGNYV